MTDATISYAEQDGTTVIRLQGAIRYTQANALDRFLDELFARGEFTHILVDLTGAESIDSTGLGLLAKIANLMRRRDGGRPLLVSSQPDINAVLNSICLDEAFVLCDGNPALGSSQALPAGDPSERELAQTVLDAHRWLCEMNDSNRLMFQNVVSVFERELGQS